MTVSSVPGPLNVLGRSRAAIHYQQDPAAEGRPVSLMLAGGILAMVSFTFAALLVKQIWLTEEVSRDWGILGISTLFVLFVGGVYVFALGYELQDAGRAVRLTLIIAVLGVAGLAFMIGAFAALAWLKSGAGALSSDHSGRVIGLVSGLREEDEEKTPVRHPLDFMINCKGCKRDFIPVPPKAVCPWCDTAYLPA